MYDFIEGRLVSRSPGGVVLQANGVGYLLQVPVSTYERVTEGTVVKLYTHLYVREDCLRLYGFHTCEEREVFRKLHSVSSVGPEKALSFLSTLAIDQICRAVVEGQVAVLTRVKGIGRKLAERICLELKDEFAATSLGLAWPPAPGAVSEALAGMAALGYSRSEARRAVDKAVQALGEETPVEDLIREALRRA